MIPVQFPESNGVVARDQGEYEPLPIYAFGDAEGRIVCCFRLSPAELAEIVKTRTLWVQQLTFNRSFQPIALSTQRPEDLPQVEAAQPKPEATPVKRVTLLGKSFHVWKDQYRFLLGWAGGGMPEPCLEFKQDSPEAAALAQALFDALP